MQTCKTLVFSPRLSLLPPPCAPGELLLPRTKGFVTLVQGLRNKLYGVLDMTIGARLPGAVARGSCEFFLLSSWC